MTGFSCSLSLELNVYHDRQCFCAPYRKLQNSKKCIFYSCQKKKHPATQHLMHPFYLGPCTSQTGLLIANGSASTKSNPRVFLLWNNRSYWAASYHCSYLSANPVWPDFLIHHSPGTSCLAEGLMNCFLTLTLISKLLHCHPEMQLQATKTVLRHSFHPACVHNASGAHSDGHETY